MDLVSIRNLNMTMKNMNQLPILTNRYCTLDFHQGWITPIIKQLIPLLKQGPYGIFTLITNVITDRL